MRLRALGVGPGARHVVAVLQGSGDDVGEVLLAATRYALEHRSRAPDPAALKAFCANAAQVERILDVDKQAGLALLLTRVDGMEPEDVAELTGLSLTVIRMADNGLEELDDLADPLPPGSQPGGHPSTVELHGFSQEALGDLLQPQVEQHVAGCSACFERFEAWSALEEAFHDLQPPAPPPPPPDRRPVLVLGAAVVALGLFSIVSLAGLWWMSVQQQDAAMAFEQQTADVDLLAGGRVALDLQDTPADTLVSVRFHPRGASWTAIGVRTPAGTQIVYRGPIADPGQIHVPPFELLYDPAEHQTFYVLLGSRPLADEEAQAAFAGSPPGDVSVAVIPLR